MGTGGMRCGAGRPTTHVKAEHCRRIDVRRWRREGMLSDGSAGSWLWKCGDTGELQAAIGYRSNGGTVTLTYSIDGRARRQSIVLTRSHCNFGGDRPWFRCPICGERVAVLYLKAGRFACGHCQRIAYSSQSNDVFARSWRRQAKAEARLGPDWRRPKGMHGITHERLLSFIFDCEERRDSALSVMVAGMLRRHPSLRDDPLFQGVR